MKTKLIIATAALALTGCGEEPPGGIGIGTIDCAEVGNAPGCGFAPSAVVETDIGQINGNQLIHVSLVIANVGSGPWQGWSEMAFNTYCHPSSGNHVPVEKAPTMLLQPGESYLSGIGSMCSGMPEGTHTFTATLWDEDGTTVLDQVTTRFTLVR